MSVVFDSTDMDVVSAFARDAYSSVRFSPRGQQRGLRIESHQLPGVRLEDVTYRMDVELETEPIGALYVGLVLDGGIRYRDRGGDRAYRREDVFLIAQPNEAFEVRNDTVRCRGAVIDPAVLGEVAQTAPGDRDPIRLLAYEPLTPAAGQAWARVYESVTSSVLSSPELMASPLVTANAARLLAASTLSAFPNTTLVDPTGEDRHDAHPDTLRRAVAFVESHPDEPITVADIATACFVTPRALQLAFRRHLDTTPMRYLHAVRMDRAHRDLITADPHHATVTEIAVRWGFANPSRFATYYRAAHGVSPSRTLRERG